MDPYYSDDTVTQYHGDCLEVMAELPDASVDAVVTDPPYGLEFMGKDWDRFAPRDRKNASVWDGRRQSQDGWTDDAKERSGKGGGGPSYRSTHKGSKRCTKCGRRAFSGSPCECPEPEWVIEHRQEAPAVMLGFQAWCEEWCREVYRVLKPGGHLLAFGGTRTWHRLAVAVEDAGFEIRDSIAWMYGSGFPKSLDVSKAIDKGEGIWRGRAGSVDSANGSMAGPNYERTPKGDPVTAAAAWQGWGTALKPAFEPIVVARKPLAGTVAANVLAHGTGALNIDGARIGDGSESQGPRSGGEASASRRYTDNGAVNMAATPGPRGGSPSGRWPANVILDESQAAALDEQSGETSSTTGVRAPNGTMGYHGGASGLPGVVSGHADSGGASRFFYTAKAGSDERVTVNGTAHPTVKPLSLMRWLVRLVTPPGGTVLEPFAGSGTTVEACILERFNVVAIEREADYLPLIEARIARRRDPARAVELAGEDMGLLGLLGEEPA